MSADFCAALLAGDAACPAGLVAWNGSDPGRRFAVYRNNVTVGLVDALADSFPVTRELVGEAFFHAMAREFVRAAPPRSPVLALYGSGFADFIAGFPPASGLPYLADLASLEMLRVLAFHAADVQPVAPEVLEALLADAEALTQARFGLHPSLHLLCSIHAVVSLWAAHQTDAPAAALEALDPGRAEAALVCRNGLEVEIFRISRGTASFIAALQGRAAFGVAAEGALAVEREFDLVASLALLLQAGAITDIIIPGSHQP